MDDNMDENIKNSIIPNHIYFVNNNIGVNNENPQTDFDIIGDMNIVGTSTILSTVKPTVYIPSSQPQIIGYGIWLLYIGDFSSMDADKILFQKDITALVSNINTEVFAICNKPLINYKNASDICLAYNSELSSKDKLLDASANGASWTDLGWTSDNSKDSNNNIFAYAPNSSSRIISQIPPNNTACAVCFGVKPEKYNNTPIKPFNTTKWSR
jgi:hypothetical protein